ncbi:MAG TPA: 16S rRNA (cytosine(967)-C(5))-methyltransferase RsmB [Candidatus Eisenbacteria bacterium]|nr:16S rRNA (cytosine(967)-C(5))-methyltransferase RsmB [Candidatus Eisenbacteria bacterium]
MKKAGARGKAMRRSHKPRPASVRDLALQILVCVQSRGAFSDKLIETYAARQALDRRDRALLGELVKGTLRRRGSLDALLAPLVHLGFEKLPAWIQNALRLGAYQLVYLDRVPAHAAVSESVSLARKYGHPGTAGLVNSVLRRLAERPRAELLAALETEGDDTTALAARTSHPEWMLERWLQHSSRDEVLALCGANNRTARVGLRANRLKLDAKELLRRLADDGIAAVPGRWAPSSVSLEGEADLAHLAVLARGDATVQDESETLVGLLVAPKPGERVLDLCAAPGGKTGHLAELMGDRGEVIALDKHPARVRALRQSVERLGLRSVDVREGDALTVAWDKPFDRVLVDAPCSGFGVLARRADARWRKKPDLFDTMPRVQEALLDAAAKAVRPGGTLVYSVCSFEPEETIDVVRHFLASHPEFMPFDAHEVLPAEVVTPEGYLRCLPHVHGTDGSFAARFTRQEAA